MKSESAAGFFAKATAALRSSALARMYNSIEENPYGKVFFWCAVLFCYAAILFAYTLCQVAKNWLNAVLRVKLITEF